MEKNLKKLKSFSLQSLLWFWFFYFWGVLYLWTPVRFVFQDQFPVLETLISMFHDLAWIPLAIALPWYLLYFVIIIFNDHTIRICSWSFLHPFHWPVFSICSFILKYCLFLLPFFLCCCFLWWYLNRNCVWMLCCMLFCWFCWCSIIRDSFYQNGCCPPTDPSSLWWAITFWSNMIKSVAKSLLIISR